MTQQRQVYIGDYLLTGFIQETLGSIVFESTHRTKCGKLAVKLLKRDFMSEQQYENETEINIEIDCDYILPIIDIVKDVPHEFFCAIVMNKAVGRDLMDVLLDEKRFTEAFTAQVAHTGLEALKYLHGQGICHRDIKPENFFFMDDDLTEPDIVLADFGHATRFQPDQLMEDYIIGTPVYSAPEIIKKEPYDESIDLWSLGCVIYCCLAGYYAFPDPINEKDPRDVQYAHNLIINGCYSFQKSPWDTISPEAKDFISLMIQVDPKNRASIDDLLKHAWIEKYYVEYNKQTNRRNRERQLADDPTEQLPRDPYDEL